MPDDSVSLRWRHGMLTMNGTTIVGTVDQGAGGDWFAHGCAADWQDVTLGSFDDEAEAKAAVETWVQGYLDA